MNLPVADLAILAVYFLLIMGFGSTFIKKSAHTEGFMAADRSLPGWLCGMSIFATYVSSISFIALPGNAFLEDWKRFTFSLSIPIAAWLAARFFVRLYRDRGEVSAYSYLEHRFGTPARLYASSFYLLTQIARMCMVMYLMALPLGELLNIDMWIIILTIGISVTIYAMMGGIEGVIWTEAIQGFILIGGAFLCALLMLFRMPEGPGQLFAIAVQHHKFSLGSFDLTDFTTATFWVILLNGVFINLQNFGIDQGYIQRYISSKSEAEAKKAVWLGGLLYIPVSASLFFIGTALFSYFTVFSDRLPAEYWDPSNQRADYVFPFFIVNELPTGVTGLLIAAICAAAMSTLATSVNSSATIVLTDYYRRFINRTAEERESMRVLYLTSLILGVLGTASALLVYATGAESALDLWWQLSSIFSGGMVGLFLLGYFLRAATSQSALVGMICGLLVIMWMSLSQFDLFEALLGDLASPFHPYLIIVFGTVTIFFVGFLVTIFTGNRNRRETD